MGRQSHEEHFFTQFNGYKEFIIKKTPNSTPRYKSDKKILNKSGTMCMLAYRSNKSKSNPQNKQISFNSQIIKKKHEAVLRRRRRPDS
jgi:hypothetical protein